MAKSTPGLHEVIQDINDKLKPKSYDFDEHSKPIKVYTLQEFTQLVAGNYMRKYNLDKVTFTKVDQLHIKNSHENHERINNRYNELCQEYKDKEYQIKVARVEGIINEGRFGDKGYDTKTPHVFNKFWNLCTFKRMII